MSKTIIHLTDYESSQKSVFIDDLSALQNFSEENGILNEIFYKSSEKPPILLNTPNTHIHNYIDETELKDRVLDISKSSEIIFISTKLESLVGLVNELREFIGQKISTNPEIFTNKYIQREFLAKNDPETSVKFVKANSSSLDFEDLEKKLSLPFILKPISGTFGLGVAKIKNKKAFSKYLDNIELVKKDFALMGFEKDYEILAEQYISGDLFSIDYYVDEAGKNFISKPIKIIEGEDLKEDFYDYVRIIFEDVEKEFNSSKLKQFIDESVKATGVRNTFVHHEFKMTKKGEFKTIELNGRIGGRVTSLYNLAYGFNLYSLLFKKEFDLKLKENVAFVKVYPFKCGILEGFNEKLFEKIGDLKSFYKVRKATITPGLGVLGFESYALIELKSENLKQLKKDLEFVEDGYSGLLEVKEEKK